VHKGRVVFGAMDEVVFGQPAPRPLSRRSSGCASPRLSHGQRHAQRRPTNRENPPRAWRALRRHFDAMPPHTPREPSLPREQAAPAHADSLFTVGGGSITDGA